VPPHSVVLEGSSANFSCPVTTLLFWRFNNSIIPENSYKKSNGELIIKGANLENQGEYSCTYNNSQGWKYKALATLMVIGQCFDESFKFCFYKNVS